MNNAFTIAGKKFAKSARGFSLLELSLVIAIIGILMAVVAVNVLGAGDRAKKTATTASLKTIKTAMGEYILKYSSPPAELRVLITEKYIADDTPLKDAWLKDFVYDPRGRSQDRPYTLGSSGPDMASGTEDDLDVWNLTKS